MDVDVPTRAVVEALVRADGTLDARRAVRAVAAALGMSDQQVRLCLKRLIAEGKVTRDGRGRRAVLRMTPDALRAAEPDVEFVRFMYRQDAGEVRWDGVWHLVAFAVPESRRSARDGLRDALVRFGGAAVLPPELLPQPWVGARPVRSSPAAGRRWGNGWVNCPRCSGSTATWRPAGEGRSPSSRVVGVA